MPFLLNGRLIHNEADLFDFAAGTHPDIVPEIPFSPPPLNNSSEDTLYCLSGECVSLDEADNDNPFRYMHIFNNGTPMLYARCGSRHIGFSASGSIELSYWRSVFSPLLEDKHYSPDQKSFHHIHISLISGCYDHSNTDEYHQMFASMHRILDGLFKFGLANTRVQINVVSHLTYEKNILTPTNTAAYLTVFIRDKIKSLCRKYAKTDIEIPVSFTQPESNFKFSDSTLNEARLLDAIRFIFLPVTHRSLPQEYLPKLGSNHAINKNYFKRLAKLLFTKEAYAEFQEFTLKTRATYCRNVIIDCHNRTFSLGSAVVDTTSIPDYALRAAAYFTSNNKEIVLLQSNRFPRSYAFTDTLVTLLETNQQFIPSMTEEEVMLHTNMAFGESVLALPNDQFRRLTERAAHKKQLASIRHTHSLLILALLGQTINDATVSLTIIHAFIAMLKHFKKYPMDFQGKRSEADITAKLSTSTTFFQPKYNLSECCKKVSEILKNFPHLRVKASDKPNLQNFIDFELIRGDALDDLKNSSAVIKIFGNNLKEMKMISTHLQDFGVENSLLVSDIHDPTFVIFLNMDSVNTSHLFDTPFFFSSKPLKHAYGSS